MWKPTDFADNPERNHTIFYILVIIAFVILLSKLWFLQVIKGDEFKNSSFRQQVREFRIPAPRGIIRDKDGKILAENRPSYNLFFHPARLDAKERFSFLEKSCEELGIDFKVAKRRFDTSKNRQPIKIKTDITREEVAGIETRNMTLGPNYPLEIEVESLRIYPLGKAGAHLLGYCDEIDPERLNHPKYTGYRPGDLVGKTGIEETYEKYLAGAYGRRRVEVNARGKPLKELEKEKGSPGLNLFLTVDKDLMNTAKRILGNRAASLVALDPRDGKVLAAVSTPGFQPEIFSRPIPQDLWDGLLNDEKHPMMNKFLQGLYPPGSTFKPITAIAGLESGVIKPKKTEHCAGKWHFRGRDFRCHAKNGHGFVALYMSIVKSCDIYYYKTGFQTGIDVLAEYAEAFGIGRKTGIDLVGEKQGVMPNREWKRTTQKIRWMPGDTLSSAIGQGYILATPLQLATAFAAFANGGTIFRPYIVRRIEDQSGKVIKEFGPKAVQKLNVDEKNLKLIHKALVGVVNDIGGTGHRAMIPGSRVAGKTGTSQVRSIHKVRKHWSQVPYEARDHAFFVSYAPAEDPEIVMVVLVEHSGHGGVVAAPIAKLVLQSYFRKKALQKRQVIPLPKEKKDPAEEEAN